MVLFEFAMVLSLLLGSILLGAFVGTLLGRRTLADMADEIQELHQRLESANRLLSMQGEEHNLHARSRTPNSLPKAAPNHLNHHGFSPSRFASAAGRSGTRVLRSYAIPLLALAVVLFVAFSFSLYYIEPGYVGLSKQDGRYLTAEAMPGRHFKIPFLHRIEEFDVRLKYVNFVKNPIESLDPLTINRQPIQVNDANDVEATVEMGLQYQIDPEMAAELVSKYGIDPVMGLIRPAVTEALKQVFSHHSVTQVENNNGILQGLQNAVFEAVSPLQDEGIHIYAPEFISVSAPEKAAKERKSKPSVQDVQVTSRSQILKPPLPTNEKEAIPHAREPAGVIGEEIERKSSEQTVQIKSPPKTVAQPTPSSEEKLAGASSLPAGQSTQKKHGLKAEINFCRDFERIREQKSRLEYKLIGRSDRFSKAVEKITCFTRIHGAVENTLIKHRWFWKKELVGEIPLAVRSKDWRTYSEFSISPQRVGTWRVDVTLRDDSLIARKSFIVE